MVHANQGGTAGSNTRGRAVVASGSGNCIASIDGGKPVDPAWVRQNGQCSIWTPCIGAGALEATPPVALQISPHAPPRAAETACDIDGASAASSMAKHAAQAANRRTGAEKIIAGILPPGLEHACRLRNGKLAPRGWHGSTALLTRHNVADLAPPTIILRKSTMLAVRGTETWKQKPQLRD
jgi:hypothetical protein